MKRILLVCLTAMFALASSAVWAQERTVTGRITSAEDGSPLPGVNVVLKGTTNGTVTDVSGAYTLKVPAEGGVLIFTFIGLTSQEMEIGNRASVDVAMTQDTQQLSEVVVTALGEQASKKSIGYAVQDIKSDELLKAREANVVNSLSGKIAGVQITNSSGSVGASSRIVIRGSNSFGNNQPLFVVDGVPISNEGFGSIGPSTTVGTGTGTGTDGVNRGNAAADLNPDDIESITVLKGPNAAALYGSRGANGVIIVKTKSGKRGAGLGIQVNSSVTFDKPFRLPDYQNSYGQGSGGIFSFEDGAGGGLNDGTDESWGPRLDVGTSLPQFNSPVVDGVRQPTPWVSHPDNIKDFFETGKTVVNSVSISGGGDKGAVRLSYTRQSQDGMIPNTDQDKNTVAINANLSVTEKFNISASANFVNTHSDNLPGYGYSGQNVMQQFVWFGRQVDIAELKNYQNAAGEKYSWNYNYHNNPYFTLNENLNGMDRNRVYGNVKAQYRFNDWLSVFVRTGTDYYSYLNTGRIAAGDIDNPQGEYSETSNTFSEVNSDFLLSFNKSLSDDIVLSLNAGGNRMTQRKHQITGNADELAVPGIYTLGNSKVALRTSSYENTKRINSLYFSGQIGFRDALFLDFSGRNDWSSTLPDGNNSYFYPAANVSVVISELAGLQSNVLTSLKVRGGFAQVGSDTDPFRLLNYVTFGDSWNAGTKLPNLFVDNTLSNPDLEPQRTNSLEFGVDASLFNNKVRAELTYYNQKTTKQLIAVPVSSSSGYLEKYINAGEISNKGVELTLGVTPLSTASGFQWDFTVNFAKNVNQVVELYPGVEQYVLGTYWSMQVAAVPGQRFGTLYGYGFERDPQGRIIHESGLPVTSTTPKALGNYTPDWTGGFNNQFSYKGILLSFLIDVKRGGDVYSMTTAWGRYAGILEETLKGREAGIVGDGVMNVGSAETPEYVTNNIVVTAEDYNKAAFSNTITESSIFDASYVKLREVRLGYTVPNSLLGKLPIRDVTFAVTGRNLALLYSKIPHVDPETSFSNTNVQGLEFGQSPSARSIGFNIGFKLQ
ncbi:SusC/RagA family TonB-linked outer membrane protein [Fulvivirgaceae bacterium PWU5]|uniref:SusC/RagA family TonB-linked outer membrane protein n=1 Tax=Dawidia cretensis TaxID=2782350 RepID=A0AAP2GS35_9BACT|nr:SusC/RagA family TonB-linked outer membrane protein [Dawidia cretensis]MBT1710939.1 SusC/RagA family TonB-linked outer membrane protein [Dawidia cretensis]